MNSCQYCGTQTGIHGFAFGADGKYSTPDMTWEEFRALRLDALKELIKGIEIVGGHVQQTSS